MNERTLEEWLGICTFLILKQGEETLAAIDDLNTNLANVGTAIDALTARIAALQTANDPAVEAAAQLAQGFADKINALAP